MLGSFTELIGQSILILRFVNRRNLVKSTELVVIFNFVLEESLLRTNIFKSISSVRLIHPFKMLSRDADWLRKSINQKITAEPFSKVRDRVSVQCQFNVDPIWGSKG